MDLQELRAVQRKLQLEKARRRAKHSCVGLYRAIEGV